MTNTRPGAATRRRRERTNESTAVPRSEGDEATRDERQDVGAVRSTDEAGEPSRGIPWREGRAGGRKPLEGTMPRTPSLDHVLPKLQRIAALAREAPQMAFTTLAHHIDVDLVHGAYRRTRKDGAVGVDGQTATIFEQKLEENLQALVDRVKSGTYFAPPVRRVHIPKGDGRTRPVLIPTGVSWGRRGNPLMHSCELPLVEGAVSIIDRDRVLRARAHAAAAREPLFGPRAGICVLVDKRGARARYVIARGNGSVEIGAKRASQ